MEVGSDFSQWLNAANLLVFLRALLVLVIGVFLIRLILAVLRRLVQDKLPKQHYMILSRIVFYVMVLLLLFSVLHEFGFNIGILLGAAGVLTVAVGFASQTSASNIISGIFLIGERPFLVGETIRVADVTGEVLSVDLLSVKLRTFDNLYVRVPNETLIKSNITNLSRFPIRRFDLKVDVAYKEDLNRVAKALDRAADQCPVCLVDPRPQMIFQGFADSALNIQFSVWAARENFLELRNSMPQLVRDAFAEDGIEIPYPRRLLTGTGSEGPVRVELVQPAPEQGPASGEPESPVD